jgi:hypothetical protein
VTFPFRIPKAELDYVYDGPDLYYCNQMALATTFAEERQDYQGVLVGYDPNPTDSSFLAGFFDIEYVVDFFDPVSPAALIGSTSEQRAALHSLRQSFRQRVPRLSPNFPDGKKALLQFAEELKEDSDRPVYPRSSTPSVGPTTDSSAAATSLEPPALLTLSALLEAGAPVSMSRT